MLVMHSCVWVGLHSGHAGHAGNLEKSMSGQSHVGLQVHAAGLQAPQVHD